MQNHTHDEVSIRSISKTRFDAFASYTRSPQVALLATEISWWETGDGRVVALVAYDTIDHEYFGIAMARDTTERFRPAGMTRFYDTPEEAHEALHQTIADVLADYETARIQGDESGTAVDFFAPVVPPKRFHAGFNRLLTSDGDVAARRIITMMMRWHEDVDGNFIQQFQSDGFDTRLWELYLWATLVEQGLSIERPSPAPDFIAESPVLGKVAIEATSVNPSVIGGERAPSSRPDAEDEEGWKDYQLNYLPIRFAGPLITKLNKKYWQAPEVASIPLAFAVQDFHDDMSMVYSISALVNFLFGVNHEPSPESDEEGSLAVHPIEEHVWGTKSVASGFFNYPDAENVSAVIASPSGTLAKFNRMGVGAGFGSDDWVLIHRAMVADPAADRARIVSRVVTPGYGESWVDGMNVFHNPTAARPLNPSFLPGATHHFLRSEGRIESFAPEAPLISSVTMTFPRAAYEAAQSAAQNLGDEAED